MRYLGFTLLELLVVIAVIAILAAVIAPALHKSKETAKELVCSSNLRQLSQALFTYADDNQTFPSGFAGMQKTLPPGGVLGNAVRDYQGWWWFHYIADEDWLKNDGMSKGLLWCPSRPNLGSPLSGNVLCSNYGVNYSLCKLSSSNQQTEFFGTPLRPERIRSASTTMLLMDAGYALISWNALLKDPALHPFEITPGQTSPRQDSFYLPGLKKINEQRMINPDQQTDAMDDRHSGKRVNVTFVDGHVSNIAASKMALDLDTADTAPNKSGWTP